MGITRQELGAALQGELDNINEQLSDTATQLATTNANVSNNTATINTHTSQIASLSSGAPKAASLVSQMTDHAKNYVYTGTESGYTAGNWYYWNGSAWTSGGVYQAMGFSDAGNYFVSDTVDGALQEIGAGYARQSQIDILAQDIRGFNLSWDGTHLVIGAGKIGNFNVPGVNKTLPSVDTTTLNYSKTNIAINNWDRKPYIVASYDCPARGIQSLIVKKTSDQSVLTLNTDYTLYTDPLSGITYINSIADSLTIDYTVTVRKCKLSSVYITLSTGDVYLASGSFQPNNPAYYCGAIDPNQYLLIGYLWWPWTANSNDDMIIYPTYGKDNFGRNFRERLLAVERSRNYKSKLQTFFERINQMIFNTAYFSWEVTRTDPILIGFFGDSTIEQMYSEIYSDYGHTGTFITYGWIDQLADLLHAKYPKAEIIYKKIWPDGTVPEIKRSYSAVGGYPLKIHLYNYGVGGKTIYQLIHQTSVFAGNASGRYSMQYHNGLPVKHDLMFLCRTNGTYMSDNASDTTIRALYQAAPYNVVFDGQISDYSTNRYLKYTDNMKTYDAELRYVYDTVANQGGDIVFIGDTPENFFKDNGDYYYPPVHAQTEHTLRLAYEKNKIFIDLYDIFRDTYQYCSVPVLITAIPSAIHPNALVSRIIAGRIFELFDN